MFATNGERCPEYQILFILWVTGDMVILLLDKLSLCAVMVIICRQLRDNLNFLLLYHHISLSKGRGGNKTKYHRGPNKNILARKGKNQNEPGNSWLCSTTLDLLNMSTYVTQI